MLEILAFADDLTGALETGARFASHRVRSLVAMGNVPAEGSCSSSFEALVIDTGSRHMSPGEARDGILKLALEGRCFDPRFLFKKTDSTLRGNIVAEFEALLAAYPGRPLVYAPAYPEQGRTVHGGRLFVNGLPLEKTEYAHDLLNPSRDGFIPRLLADHCAAHVHQIAGGESLRRVLPQAPARSIIICDCTTDSDLERIASVLAECERPYIAAGTGAFAGIWARALPLQAEGKSSLPSASNCLVVCGSLNPASRAQIIEARRNGMPVIELEDGGSTACAVVQALAANPWVILASSTRLVADVLEPAARLASVVRKVFQSAAPSALAVFGGDTAAAVLSALDVRTARPCGELQPGVPISWIEHAGGTTVLVTKAGGFSGTDAVSRIRKLLESQ